MKVGDFVSALLFVVLGAFGAYRSQSFGLGTAAEPGAGFMPFWASILILGCAFATAVRALFFRETPAASVSVEAAGVEGTDAADAEPLSPNGYTKLALCIVMLVLYAVALPLIGFVISTFIVMLVLSRFDPRTSWRGALAIAALGAFGFWALFVLGLDVSFPAPPFGF